MTADGYPLATNIPVYRLFAHPYLVEQPAEQVAKLLAPIVVKDNPNLTEQEVSQNISQKLSDKNSRWASLYSGISEESKSEIQDLKIKGLGFDPYEKRFYPEASMAAHITGFVGKNEAGEDVGYFGIEGALEKELQARSETSTVLTDALGLRLLGSDAQNQTPLDGRTVVTTIHRDVQFILEENLKAGIRQYGASAGEAIVMDPKTGKILGSASYPSYDQSQFNNYSPEFYKNPSIANLYEPGSTFKVLTVAAGIDAGVITPETVCSKCAGPRIFGEYSIGTWNNEYKANTTIMDGLTRSDNTAMIFVAELVGANKFADYLRKFKIGETLGIDLQEDTNTPFPSKWGPVELATISFGQGISLNSLQLLRAVGAIANNGVIMRPMIVEEVVDPITGDKVVTPIKPEGQVVSPQTAKTVTQMMINAARAGEAQWTASRTHTIAGKTGTSQVASGGSYDKSKTVASFIGFAPVDDPKFIMLVKLTEPTSSVWAAETATPLWYKIADRLFLLFNIPPDIQD